MWANIACRGRTLVILDSSVPEPNKGASGWGISAEGWVSWRRCPVI